MNRWQLHLAIKTLQSGGVIAYPTESVFGLGCDASNLKAVAKILSIKKRSYKKGLILLVSDIQQAFPYINQLSQAQIKKINEKNSRATTWLIEKNNMLSPLLSGKHLKLAVRVTSHPIAKILCESINRPIVSTSCNLNGKPTSVKTCVVRNKNKINIDGVLSGVCSGQQASRIIDLETMKVFR
jgi:L-threonylcarbamoyladenylate synthase